MTAGQPTRASGQESSGAQSTDAAEAWRRKTAGYASERRVRKAADALFGVAEGVAKDTLDGGDVTGALRDVSELLEIDAVGWAADAGVPQEGRDVIQQTVRALDAGTSLARSLAAGDDEKAERAAGYLHVHAAELQRLAEAHGGDELADDSDRPR